MTEVTTKPGNGFSRLYRGQTTIRFVERRRIWFTISAVIIIVGLVSLGIRGFNLGIEFKGGSSWTVLANGSTTQAMDDAVTKAGLPNPTVVQLGSGNNRTIQVQADINNLSATAQQSLNVAVIDAMAKTAHTATNQVSATHVGPTWGANVTSRALWALVVFFIVVAIYISFRFEPKMALAAFLAMLHDLLITIGVYSICNFQVTPDTVVALLTILGYSLYDTVVVFDRITDNVKQFGSTSPLTYSEMVDLSMNQTLARSINTSLVAILPVLSVLLVGALLLGATTLLNYGVALFVGLVSGAYSSIFIASPILAMLKEREPRYIALRERLATRRDRHGHLSPLEAAQLRGGATIAAKVPVAAGSAAAQGSDDDLESAGLLRPTGIGTTAASTGLAPAGSPPKPRTQRGKKRR